jgi:N6-adenosine-specific RNA methylase IME4
MKPAPAANNNLIEIRTVNREEDGMPALVLYNAARKALAEAHSVDEVKDIRDKAFAMQVYASQAKDMRLIDHATDIRIRAEIRAGELLAETERAKRGPDKGTEQRSQRATSDAPTLAELGITKTQSWRWQKLAELPEEEREEKIQRAKRKAKAAIDGTAKQERAEMRAADEARVMSLIPRDGKFRTLVIDPPWDYERLSLAGRASPGYATMSHEQLLALNVPQWAEDNCHLYLWTTNNFMTRAVDLMARWGFQHKTVLTWVKPRWGLGSYFRNSTEHVLFGVRGELRTRSDSIGTHFEAPVAEHSEKPEQFYEIVRKTSHPVPHNGALVYGEIFQRQERPDFLNLYTSRVVFG